RPWRTSSRTLTETSATANAIVIPPAAAARSVLGRKTKATQPPTAARPSRTASATRMRLERRPDMAPARAAAATTAEAANAIWTASSRSTTSGYAGEHQCEGECDHRGGERSERSFVRRREGFASHLLGGSVAEVDAASDVRHAPPHRPDRRRQEPLCGA